MGRFLDAQGSQNASYTTSISIPVTTTPTVFGSLGLDISGAAGGTVGVNLQATVTLASITAVSGIVNLSIIRNGSTLVYSSAITTPGTLFATFDAKLTAFDHNIPTTPNFLTYEVRIRAVDADGSSGVNLQRVGPESFTAIAYVSP
ncbi:hypothetical protein [Paenibacillus agilis]|uniref:Exosporium protein C n=1 Tax=Paenibacillus agilis TaxID=3020863 RepID=A0A559J309_9BACL|nr:hypothetical protein [Paenibacillus agilis]TVX94270.1 hypothetical protein FPZ44_15155 [Paenibacillus agilis]